WNHTDPFPNSEVKRCCGDDSLGVALRENSSMPGLILHNNPFHYLTNEGVLFFWLNQQKPHVSLLGAWDECA
ncbi:hypothetical protein MEO93_28665, partial [Dolichospermum sp. ST_sed3]|nr:hypothetical protein [Dolichospermum sp. ST_sed3]